MSSESMAYFGLTSANGKHVKRKRKGADGVA